MRQDCLCPYRRRSYFLGISFTLFLSLIPLLVATFCLLKMDKPVLSAEQAQPTDTSTKPQNWTGKVKKLKVNEGVTLNSTPKGDLIVAVQNLSTMPDKGKVVLKSGDNPPEYLCVPALTNAPLIEIRNYNGNSLKVTNVSKQALIQIAAYAPGYGGEPKQLPDNGKFRSLKHYSIREGPTKNNTMQLTMKADSAYTVLVTFFGAEATVYCMTAPTPPPEWCMKSTKDNQLTVTGNWGGVDIYIVNLSPQTSPKAEVALTNLAGRQPEEPGTNIFHDDYLKGVNHDLLPSSR